MNIEKLKRILVLPQMAKVKWVSANIKHYESKGYVFTKVGDEFYVDVLHLIKCSDTIVKCYCQDCEEIIELPYNHLTIRNKNIICDKCKSKKYKSLRDILDIKTYIVYPQYTIMNWHTKHREYYESKGYIFTQWNDEFKVDVLDLPVGSNKEIECYCNYCDNTTYKKVKLLVKDYTNICCENCKGKKIRKTVRSIYNVDSVTQIPAVRAKQLKTMEDRYGQKYAFQVPELYDKMIQTNIERYDTPYPIQLQEMKEKRVQTNLEIYGYESASQDPAIREKIKETNLTRYGYEYILQVPEMLKKMEQTNLERYGYENVSQSPIIRDKVKQTNLNNWGVENVFQSEVIKEQIKEINLERYGYEYVGQIPQFREKANITMYKNGTGIAASKQQIHLCNILNGELNYPAGYYPVDIAYPDKMLYIEYDGGGHDLCVKLGSMTPEEFKQKEIRRSYYLKYRNWKHIRIKCANDKLLSDGKMIELVNIGKEYLLNSEHSWFYIDLNTMQLICSQYTKDIIL